MLSERIKSLWRRTPFVWKSFFLYVPLFTFVFSFFLILALYEIRINVIQESKSNILAKIEKIKLEEADMYDLDSIAEDLQIVIYNMSGQPLVEINRFHESSPFIKINSFQQVENKKVLLYNCQIEFLQNRYLLQIAKNLSTEERIFSTMRGFFGLILFAGLIIAAALSIPITRVLLKNITRIIHTAEQISYEDLSKRIELPGAKDEFDLLAQTLNTMIERIQISADAQKKFVSNASHELRTPIAVIKGYSQLLTRWGSENPAIIKEAAIAIDNEIEMIETLMKELLLLARVDSKLNDLITEFFDIKVLILQILKDNELIYPKREFKHSFDEIDNSTILGDKWLLKSLFRILTDNAIKYSPADKPIEYHLQQENSSILIKIVDHGPGISDEHKEHVFHRFYRIDEDRNRDKGGAGLGLAIAKRIVTLHKGEITIADTEGGGATIIINLPQVETSDNQENTPLE